MASQSVQSPRSFHLAVAEALLVSLRSGDRIEPRRLRSMCDDLCGRSAATGAWSMRQAYDALELAQVLYMLMPDCPLLDGDPAATVAALEAFGETLPVQSVRSEQQVALQQFSTPLPLAFIAGLAASATSRDTVLEPSAGNGLLAWTAARAAAKLALNELDPERAASLVFAYPRAAVSGHDAELIDDMLPPAIRPTLILMNPPFGRSIGRGADRHAAARHLAAAISRLAPGGRLVAIMPENFTDGGAARAVRARIAEVAAFRLDVGIGRGAFARHGTGVPVRMVVLDKGSPGRCIAGHADRAVDLLDFVQRLPERPSCEVGEKPAAALLSLFGRRNIAVQPARRDRPPLGSSTVAEALAYEVLETPAPPGEQVGIYLPYHPSRIRIAHAREHPTPLVESLAMGSIAAPPPDYAPLLPTGLAAEGRLSHAQLETLVYAGSAFGKDLPGRYVAAQAGCGLDPAGENEGAAYRRGYFLGDGTGAGKGRQLAGIILDQWLRGNRRHIWLSKNETLLEDARRDWTALGGIALDIQPLSRWALGASIALDQGIVFVTYPTLRSGREDATRLQQLLEWATPEFAGVIAFDESHAMANAAGGETSRGAVKGSEQGIAGIRLQNLLPRARVVYASATGASDVNNLAYAGRLGLWGPETAFADRGAFVESIRRGGIAAMELVARDLKAMGLYASRALSFAGVEYELLEHSLNPEQIAIYDAYADAWTIIHRHLDAALEATRIVDAATGGTLNANAKSAALSRFEGTKQRFFGQLLLSMKLPSLLREIESDLEAGQSVVVQLVSTGEAMLGRRLAEAATEGAAFDSIDPSPREYVIDYLAAAFPTRQMLVFTDAEGNTRSEPMSDDAGRPILCQAALRARDDLIEQLCALPPIATALDALIERFGADHVAEVTGRTRRLVTGSDGQQKLETRPPSANLREADAFMQGDKRILVFSDAGGTGRSYHACLTAQNQSRRVHYLLEPGWRADAAIQGLGRTHRTRQASAPLFRPVTTDVRGERRFISTIARRLDALGALTRGQRQTGGQNLFDPADNLESGYAKNALLSWYRLLHAGKLAAVTLADFQAATGLRLEADGGGLREDLPPIQRWLNRLLALRIAQQNAIFDEFAGLIEARVAAARDAGTLDLGVETYAVDRCTVRSDRVLRTDPGSGAATHLLELDLARRARPMPLDRVLDLCRSHAQATAMINARSGKAALRLPARSLLTEEGTTVPRYRFLRPLKHEFVRCDTFEETSWQAAGATAFATAWADEVCDAQSRLTHESIHLATGLLLPVWDKLSDDYVQVVRIAAADGQNWLGREVPVSDVAKLGERLGIDIPLSLAPAELAQTVLAQGGSLPLRSVDPLVLKRSLVGGEQRLELTGYCPSRLGWYKAQGCFTAVIRYHTRLFVPVDRAADVLVRLIPPADH